MAKVTGSSITTTIPFSVSKVSKLTSVLSPEVLMFGFPWQIEVKKFQNGTEAFLAAYLHCTKKEEDLDWKATACATITLVPFNDDQRAVEFFVKPCVYHRFSHGYGKQKWIKWNDLFNEDNKYVKDDTIQLEAKIKVEDPNSASRSTMQFESFDCCCLASIQLTVTNVSNLMAVQSPEFIMRGMPWYIMVYKNDTQLGVLLKLMQRSVDVSCQVTMSVQLISIKKADNSIEKAVTQKIQWPGNLYMGHLVPWEEMMKPQNGFVTDDSITLKIELKSNKPVGAVLNVSAKNLAKRRRLECSICLEELYDQAISVTKCGHSFCTACITTAVRKRRVCPMCKKAVNLTDLRPLFLSGGQ